MRVFFSLHCCQKWMFLLFFSFYLCHSYRGKKHLILILIFFLLLFSDLDHLIQWFVVISYFVNYLFMFLVHFIFFLSPWIRGINSICLSNASFFPIGRFMYFCSKIDRYSVLHLGLTRYRERPISFLIFLIPYFLLYFYYFPIFCCCCFFK